MVVRHQSNVVLAQDRLQRRMPRNPKHNFNIRHQPFEICPFFIAPVLPGETLKSFAFQAKARTDAIVNGEIGWWLEYYVFYVKLRDLTYRTQLTAMMLEPGRAMTDIDNPTTNVWSYHPGTAGNIDYTALCLEAITENYFREEGQLAWDFYYAQYPVAQVQGNSWLDSMVPAAQLQTPTEPEITVGVDDKVGASEIELALQQWQMLRNQQLTDQTWEEYLMTYGVKIPQAEELNRPELLRYVRQWTVPGTKMDTSSDAADSFCVWNTSERADKDRFFKEPGFVFGVTVARPKVYLSKQVGSLAHLMNDVYRWLPATLQLEKAVGIKLIDNANALLESQTTDYWVDFRDLFMYGDQFVNFALSDTLANLVPLPTAAGQKRYITTESWVNALFVSPAATPPRKFIRQDGRVDLNVLGSVYDAYPTVTG